MEQSTSYPPGSNRPWLLRGPGRIIASVVAAAVAYLLTLPLPDELNLLIPYDVGVAVYLGLFCAMLDFLVGSVDNISAMEFKRYDSSSYQMARDASVWGKADPSLEDTVNGILKFMYRKGIISVAAREVNAVSGSDQLLDCTNELSTTAS